MDLKEPGNLLYIVGVTKNELGGSHFAMVEGLSGGEVPKVDAKQARIAFTALHKALYSGLVRACHDLSEGGLAVAAAEMAFAGGLGAKISLDDVPVILPRPLAGEGPLRVRAALELCPSFRPCRPLCCSANRTRGSSAKSGPAAPPPSRPPWPAFPMPRLARLLTTASWRFAVKRRLWRLSWRH